MRREKGDVVPGGQTRAPETPKAGNGEYAVRPSTDHRVPPAPWWVEREDDEDGSINYHIWSKEPVTWLFSVYGRDHVNAKAIAEMVVTAINTAVKF